MFSSIFLGTLPETNSSPMKIPIFPGKYHQNGGFSSQRFVSLQEGKFHPFPPRREDKLGDLRDGEICEARKATKETIKGEHPYLGGGK